MFTGLTSLAMRQSSLLEEPVSKGSVFLSYNHADEELVSACYEEMRACGVPVHLDRRSLGPGRHLRHTIRHLVEESPNFVVFVSRESLRDVSGWIRIEMEQAIERGRRIYFLAVILEDLRLPGFLGGRIALDVSRLAREQIPRTVASHFQTAE